MSAITKTFKYTVRTFKYLWFIKTYWLRQAAFDIQAFNAIVLNGQTLISNSAAEEEELMPVNHYYTRYEGTARAAK